MSISHYWVVRAGGRQDGPFEADQLRAMWASGAICATDRIQQGDKKSLPAGEVLKRIGTKPSQSSGLGCVGTVVLGLVLGLVAILVLGGLTDVSRYPSKEDMTVESNADKWIKAHCKEFAQVAHVGPPNHWGGHVYRAAVVKTFVDGRIQNVGYLLHMDGVEVTEGWKYDDIMALRKALGIDKD